MRAPGWGSQLLRLYSGLHSFPLSFSPCRCPSLVQTIKCTLGESGWSYCLMTRSFGRKVSSHSVLFSNQALSHRGLMFSTFLKFSFVIKEMNKEVLNISEQSPASPRLKPRNNICKRVQWVPATRDSMTCLSVIKPCSPSISNGCCYCEALSSKVLCAWALHQ